MFSVDFADFALHMDELNMWVLFHVATQSQFFGTDSEIFPGIPSFKWLKKFK